MSPIFGLQALLVAVVALDQFVDRTHHARYRRVRRSWRETARALSADERGAVRRAARRGVAVTDPDLAAAAVVRATALSTPPPHGPLAWMRDGMSAAWVTWPVVVNGARHQWGWVALACLGPILFVGLAVHGARVRARAEAALADYPSVVRPLRAPLEPLAVLGGPVPGRHLAGTGD
ncbi:MAG: hypothetical protein QOI99_1308 [Actinomycetota bacterium]|nr:hypothetical protein [Actinomycetota bacterium]